MLLCAGTVPASKRTLYDMHDDEDPLGRHTATSPPMRLLRFPTLHNSPQKIGATDLAVRTLHPVPESPLPRQSGALPHMVHQRTAFGAPVRPPLRALNGALNGPAASLHAAYDALQHLHPLSALSALSALCHLSLLADVAPQRAATATAPAPFDSVIAASNQPADHPAAQPATQRLDRPKPDLSKLKAQLQQLSRRHAPVPAAAPIPSASHPAATLQRQIVVPPVDTATLQRQMVVPPVETVDIAASVAASRYASRSTPAETIADTSKPKFQAEVAGPGGAAVTLHGAAAPARTATGCGHLPIKKVRGAKRAM